MKNKNKDANHNKKNENKNENEIEIVIGDESVLNISEVSDCMNTLRPKGVDKKKVIIPVNKKKKNENSNSKKDTK